MRQQNGMNEKSDSKESFEQYYAHFLTGEPIIYLYPSHTRFFDECMAISMAPVASSATYSALNTDKSAQEKRDIEEKCKWLYVTCSNFKKRARHKISPLAIKDLMGRNKTEDYDTINKRIQTSFDKFSAAVDENNMTVLVDNGAEWTHTMHELKAHSEECLIECIQLLKILKRVDIKEDDDSDTLWRGCDE